jgi:hypothetical protein
MIKKNIPNWLYLTGAIFCVILLGLIDWKTGEELNFFVFYFIPVSIAAWFSGQGASVCLSILSAILWFGADALSGHSHSIHFYTIWDTMIRLVSFITIGWSIAKIRKLLDHQNELVKDLQQSISQVKVLETFIPICCQCKKIRSKDGTWSQLEKYISEHSDTQFSHGYCPECAKKALIEAGIDD